MFKNTNTITSLILAAICLVIRHCAYVYTDGLPLDISC